MNNKPIFIDGIKRINFMGGTIRIELSYKKPTEYDEDNSESVGELIMSPDGFIEVMNAMQQTTDILIEKEILGRTDAASKQETK